MKKYMALYMATAAAIDEMMKATPEQMKAGMDEWTKWGKSNEGVIVDFGAPLGKTKRLTADGLSDTRNDITGYSVVKGESPEALAKIFKGNPHLQMKGTWIELIECMEIPGM